MIRRLGYWLIVLVTVLAVRPSVGLARLKIEEEPLAQSAEVHRFCERVATGWRVGDHSLLSDLVADDGVRISLSPVSGRDNFYSSNQAFYFFKNLFQSAETDTFWFLKKPDEARSGLVTGMAEWKYHRTGAEEVTEVRLVFTLVHGTAGWGLAELRAVR